MLRTSSQLLFRCCQLDSSDFSRLSSSSRCVTTERRRSSSSAPLLSAWEEGGGEKSAVSSHTCVNVATDSWGGPAPPQTSRDYTRLHLSHLNVDTNHQLRVRAHRDPAPPVHAACPRTPFVSSHAPAEMRQYLSMITIKLNMKFSS